MAAVSHSELLPRQSDSCSPLLTCLSSGIIGSHASIVGEDGLRVSFTNRVVPKSLRLRRDDSSAMLSFAETLSSGRISGF